MFCAISGEVPVEPVVSKKSGLLFERSLIEKYIQEEGKCPVTQQELSHEDLIVLKGNKSIRPKTVTAMSIPNMLTSFQNEWDEMMLETFSLRQQLDMVRQELSQALYQHDAACRVIARLMRERDEARSMITSLQANGFSVSSTVPRANGAANVEAIESVAESDVQMEVSEVSGKAVGGVEGSTALDEKVMADVNSKWEELSTLRKQRKVSDDLASKSAVMKMSVQSSFTPHKADKSSGVTSVAVCDAFGDSGSPVILSAGTDKTAIITDRTSGKVISKLTGHTKRVCSAVFHPSADSKVIFTSSADGSVKVWNSSSSAKYTAAWTYKGHKEEVSALSIHPTGSYLVSISEEAWHFLDVSRESCLMTVKNDDYSSTAATFHPDGLLLGTGTSQGNLKIYDVREQKYVAELVGHTASIRKVAFSENGYLVATGSDDGTVKIWDLRKQKCSKSLEFGSAPIVDVAFDYSGVYLAAAGGGSDGSNIFITVVKEWPEPLVLSELHSKPVTSLSWGKNAAYLVTGSLDRSIKVLEASDA